MDYEILGATAVVAIAGFKAIEMIVKSFTNKKNGVTQIDTHQEVDIAVLQELQKIASNDLFHIRAILEKHTIDLEEIKVNVAEINVKMDSVIKI